MGAFFTYLAGKSTKRLVVVIDGVQYLVRAEKGFLSTLQKYWDLYLSSTKIMLILCGSLVSFMEGILSGKSPIYGRRTGTWKVEEMSFFDVLKFHPIDIETAIKIYGVFGGVPQYWVDYDPGKDFWENIKDLVLSKGAKYYDEPKYLLKEELRDVSRYFSILRAISLGYSRFGQIADAARIETKSLGKYLNVLEEMGYIREEKPIVGRGKTVYKINEHFFNFWFRFVFPRRSEIEMGFDVVEEIKKEFNNYLGPVFEEISRQFLIEMNKRKKLPFRFTKIGRWWYKGEEIDLVALNEDEKKALFIEVKWKNLERKEAYKILKDLKRKAELTGLHDWNKAYGIIAKSIMEKEELREEGFLAWDLRDFELIN
ncbi:ATP-binding protein [Pyrococcus horikoshii]|nr:ATP-binding protein [Pyrococcus horikoshii]